MGKIAASVLFKLFIDGNEICHTTEASKRMRGTYQTKQNTIHDPKGPEKYNYTKFNQQFNSKNLIKLLFCPQCKLLRWPILCQSLCPCDHASVRQQFL